MNAPIALTRLTPALACIASPDGTTTFFWTAIRPAATTTAPAMNKRLNLLTFMKKLLE